MISDAANKTSTRAAAPMRARPGGGRNLGWTREFRPRSKRSFMSHASGLGTSTDTAFVCGPTVQKVDTWQISVSTASGHVADGEILLAARRARRRAVLTVAASAICLRFGRMCDHITITDRGRAVTAALLSAASRCFLPSWPRTVSYVVIGLHVLRREDARQTARGRRPSAGRPGATPVKVSEILPPS